jgi:hypothetical protein
LRTVRIHGCVLGSAVSTDAHGDIGGWQLPVRVARVALAKGGAELQRGVEHARGKRRHVESLHRKPRIMTALVEDLPGQLAGERVVVVPVQAHAIVVGNDDGRPMAMDHLADRGLDARRVDRGQLAIGVRENLDVIDTQDACRRTDLGGTRVAELVALHDATRGTILAARENHERCLDAQMGIRAQGAGHRDLIIRMRKDGHEVPALGVGRQQALDHGHIAIVHVGPRRQEQDHRQSAQDAECNAGNFDGAPHGSLLPASSRGRNRHRLGTFEVAPDDSRLWRMGLLDPGVRDGGHAKVLLPLGYEALDDAGGGWFKVTVPAGKQLIQPGGRVLSLPLPTR